MQPRFAPGTSIDDFEILSKKGLSLTNGGEDDILSVVVYTIRQSGPKSTSLRGRYLLPLSLRDE